MDPEREDYADDSRRADPATLGSLAVAFGLAAAAVLGPLSAIMAFIVWSGLW